MIEMVIATPVISLASLLLVACLSLAVQAASPPESPAPAALLDTALQQEETQVFPQPLVHLSDSFQQRAAAQIPLYGDSEVDLEGEGRSFAPQGGVARQHGSAAPEAEQSRIQGQTFRQGPFSQARRYGQTSHRLEALYSQRENQNQAAASFQTQRSQSRFSGSSSEGRFQEDEDSRASGEGVKPSAQRSSASRGSQKYRAADGDLESMRVEKEMGSYQYSYDIRSEDTGDMKYHKESRDGDRVTGEYRVREPDGSMRIVRYTADKDNGFQATVEYMPKETDEEPEFGMKMSSKNPRTQGPRVRSQSRRPLTGPSESQPENSNSNFRGSESSSRVQSEASEGKRGSVNSGGDIGVPTADRDLSVFVSSQASQLDSSQQEFQSQDIGYSDNAQASQQQYFTGQENDQNQRQVQLQSQLQSRFRNHFKGSKDSSLQNENENAHAGEQFQHEQEFQSHSLNQNQLQTQVAGGFQNQEVRGFQNQEVGGFHNQEIGGFQNQEVRGFQNQEAGGFQNQEVRGFQSQEVGGFQKSRSWRIPKSRS
ncbi:uncharacterized protein LOC125033208 [Penaeus chinensis]|uniref:uncharacterized protein LOC125033208 n=1 Tax=Penaeus chinensis TaxID=139456 RepID=UPI001FB6069D|nr:uncharacterized protein LOC125033208 [Penaeus chinensis]